MGGGGGLYISPLPPNSTSVCANLEVCQTVNSVHERLRESKSTN